MIDTIRKTVAEVLRWLASAVEPSAGGGRGEEQ
jgi:hypothetical protein